MPWSPGERGQEETEGLRPPSLPSGPQDPRSLVLDLEVEVPTEPVNEERGLYITGGCQLSGVGRAQVREAGLKP